MGFAHIRRKPAPSRTHVGRNAILIALAADAMFTVLTFAAAMAAEPARMLSNGQSMKHSPRALEHVCGRLAVTNACVRLIWYGDTSQK